ncbi:hypothetical protein BD311DRAFT_802952 [Dichomitus squalens]|uniref:Uncharacterized protein n=1 Tax=Dichomitus squalens TaxID=114155 RepID=A0A4Q9MZQ6_9APHY|nr:hypothetical protein BD311DRAFT_802952 [Dichomitus squalens]
MARTSHPSARLTRSSQDKAASNPLLGIPLFADASSVPFDPARHRPQPPSSTGSDDPSCAGQQVDVQLRTYIWVPGTVLRADYHARYGNVVYEIQYVAADGSRRREGFFPKDVRRMNAKDAL